MTFKANPHNRTRVIVVAGLDDVRPVTLKCLCRLLGRPNDGDVSRFVLIGIRENHDDQVAAIGLFFRHLRPGQPAPSLALRLLAGQPFGLSVRQQDLAVPRWSQYVNPQSLCGRRRKRAAMRVIARSFIGSAPVGFSGFPIHMLVCNPEGFDVHAIEKFRQTPARCRDLAAAGTVWARRDVL